MENQNNSPVQKSPQKPVILYPSERERWLNENTNNKLANVLFAKNPFDQPKKSVAEKIFNINHPSNQQLEKNEQQQKKQLANAKNELSEKQTPIAPQIQIQNPQQYIQPTNIIQQQPNEENNKEMNIKQNQQKNSNQSSPIQLKNSKPQTVENSIQNHTPTKLIKEQFKQPEENIQNDQQQNANQQELYQQYKEQQIIKPQSQKYQYLHANTYEIQSNVNIQNYNNNNNNNNNQIKKKNETKKFSIQDVSKIQQFIILIEDFHANSQEIAEKLDALDAHNNVFMDCIWKNQQKRIFLKQNGLSTFTFNQTIELDCLFDMQNLDFEQEIVVFSLWCYRKPQNSEEQKYFKIKLGEGQIQLIEIFKEAQHYINLYSNLPLGRETNHNSNFEYRVVNQTSLQEYQEQTTKLGELRIITSLKQKQNIQIQDQTQQQNIIYYQSFNPSLFIKLTKPNGINNGYWRFKIPGTNHFFKSEISGLQDFEIITPLNYESFCKIEKIPLIVEVWQEETLLGVIRISLKAIKDVSVQQDQQFNPLIFKNIHPMIVVEENMQILRLSDCVSIGSTNVLIAFGMPDQINRVKLKKYNKNTQDCGNQCESQIFKDLNQQQQEFTELQNQLQEVEDKDKLSEINQSQDKIQNGNSFIEYLNKNENIIKQLIEDKLYNPIEKIQSNTKEQSYKKESQFLDQEQIKPITVQQECLVKSLQKYENNDQDKPEELNFYIHKFEISLKEIQNVKLTIPYGQQFEIHFHYPLCEQSITSYPQIYQKLSNYQIPMESTYTYIQKIEEKTNFIDVVDSTDGGFLFVLKSKGEFIAQSLLSSAEVAEWMKNKEQFSKQKTLVFMPINAKLSFVFSYQRFLISQLQLAQDPELLANHNQTQQQIQMPKRIYFKLYVQVSLNDKVIKIDTKTIKVEIESVFKFTKEISKNQRFKQIVFNEEKSCQVNEDFIKKIQSEKMIIKVSSNGNNLIGKCELLQNSLLVGGIKGEYALTNIQGLFVGIVILNCNLVKQEIPETYLQTKLDSESEREY